ncbi:zinc finger HIT domain-containing protein 2 [Pelodytes ibericus]
MAGPESEVLLPGRSTSPTPAFTPYRECGGNDGPGLCSLCLSGPGRYTCPRCNAPYCSLACYRGPRHTACSEDFYRESVLQVLREEQAGPDGKRQMEEMLLKLRKEEVSEEQCVGLDGVQEMDDEEAGLWSTLTSQERQDFHRLLQSGGIGALVPEWRPWWETARISGTKNNPNILEFPTASNKQEPPIIEERIHGIALTCQLDVENDPSVTRLPKATNDVKEEDNGKSFPKVLGSPEEGMKSTPITTTQADTLISCQSDQNNDGENKIHLVQIPGPLNLQETLVQDQDIERFSDLTRVKLGTETEAPYSIDLAEESIAEECAGNLAHLAEVTKRLRIHEDVSEQDTATSVCQGVESEPRLSSIPAQFNCIPPLCTLSRNPSQIVQFSVVNALYGYAFSLKRHNGDLGDEDILLDFTGTLLGISGTLSSTVVYSSTAHALKSAVRAASDPLLGGNEVVASYAMEATRQILEGDGTKLYSLSALAHMSRLLGRARKLVVQDNPVRRVVFNAKKKCLFLAAWVNENENHLLMLSEAVKIEHQQHMQCMSGVTQMSKRLQKVWGGERPPEKKTLIEEVGPEKM